MTATDNKSEISAGYDEVAEEYVRRIAGELEHKPFDRELLDWCAAMFDANETVCGYLGEAGFDVEEALERDPYPDVEYPSRRAYILAFKRLRT